MLYFLSWWIFLHNDSRILELVKVPSRAWLHGESSPNTCHPFLCLALAQISISRILAHIPMNTPALTTNLLPELLQTALCPPLKTRIHIPGHTPERQTQVRDPHGSWKWTQGFWGTKFLGADNSECDVEGVQVPSGPTKLSYHTQRYGWGWDKLRPSEEQSAGQRPLLLGSKSGIGHPATSWINGNTGHSISFSTKGFAVSSCLKLVNPQT